MLFVILYKEFNISLVSETLVQVEQLNYTIPFIYSDMQEINLNENKESFELSIDDGNDKE